MVEDLIRVLLPVISTTYRILFSNPFKVKRLSWLCRSIIESGHLDFSHQKRSWTLVK